MCWVSVLGSPPFVGCDGDVGGFGEEGAALDVVVADQLEGFALGVDGGLVVEGAIAEAVDEVGGDAVAVGDLGELAVAEDGAGLGADDEEAVDGALGVADGDGVGCGGGCECGGEG